MDGGDAPDVHAGPARRATGGRFRHTRRISHHLRIAKTPDPQAGPRPRRALAAPPDDRLVVPLARGGTRQASRRGVTEKPRMAKVALSLTCADTARIIPLAPREA